MLRPSLALTLLLPAAVYAQADSPAKTSQKAPWVAADDLRAMAGRWQMQTDFSRFTSENLPKDRHGKPIVTSLFERGAVLTIRGDQYKVEGSRDSGKVFNTYSKIKFRPANNRWLNTQEPLISLNTNLGSKALFSYVVSENFIRFRFPAHSCSRSGIRITLKRIDEGTQVKD